MTIHHALHVLPRAPRAARTLPRQRVHTPWALWGVILLLALVAVGTLSCVIGCQAPACGGSAASTHTCEPAVGAYSFDDASADAPAAPFMHVCHHAFCHAVPLPVATLLTALAVVAVLHWSTPFARYAARVQPLAPPAQHVFC